MSAGQFMEPTALVLSGGGARGAYQAGAIQAITEIAGKGQNPFRIITGVSAGAINAAYLATQSADMHKGAQRLSQVWCTLRTSDIIRTDAFAFARIMSSWISDFILSGLQKKRDARALLDTNPLHQFLSKNLQLDQIQSAIDDGHLDAVAITSTDYTSSQSISFVQGKKTLKHWARKRRHSIMTPITVDHVMASSAIPLLFPPIKLGDRYFGDGCLRNSAPLSPAIRLGAKKLIVISVRKATEINEYSQKTPFQPSIVRTLGVILNNVLMDAIEVDIDALSRLNDLTKRVADHDEVKPIDFLWLHPSEDIAAMAYEESKYLPKLLRRLIGGLGNMRDASEMVSYLLFEPEFCKRAWQLGYDDTWRRRAEVEAFLFQDSTKVLSNPA